MISQQLFWTTQLVGCWENKPGTDGDPDGAANGLGAPPVEASLLDYGWAGPSSSSENAAAIFLETIDDVIRNIGLAAATTDEAHTVVHEIAHNAGTNINGHGTVDNQGNTTDWTGIMRAKAPRNADYFDNIHLRFLREVDTW